MHPAALPHYSAVVWTAIGGTPQKIRMLLLSGLCALVPGNVLRLPPRAKERASGTYVNRSKYSLGSGEGKV